MPAFDAVTPTGTGSRGARPSRAAIPHPDPEQITVQGLLEALADPVRRDIAARLSASDEPMRCGAFDGGVSLSTLTHHFHVLREAGLIRQFYRGASKLNELRTEDVGAVAPGLLEAIFGARR
ncbi:hypothetical protein DSM104299_05109 [Baekduia alba]|uniref:ArsR/SmtB family transcription factor n=1 Tax=Baekduia alba TaxID=2997333 RepID=UPI0023422AED|nr:helix-turn-helix transcriptional regulator [Baekduia alba]WCB96352.1 hypothetical protein DSM104299_05109 [Baekduia alba]